MTLSQNHIWFVRMPEAWERKVHFIAAKFNPHPLKKCLLHFCFHLQLAFCVFFVFLTEWKTQKQKQQHKLFAKKLQHLLEYPHYRSLFVLFSLTVNSILPQLWPDHFAQHLIQNILLMLDYISSVSVRPYHWGNPVLQVSQLQLIQSHCN